MSTYDTAKEILLRRQPTISLRPQPQTDWSGDFTLPAAVADYFAEFGPDDLTIDTYGNSFYLPSLTHLWKHQRGYRTDGRTGERLADWDDDWLVIADQGADPFIFSRLGGGVLHAFHGEGVWQPEILFRDLPEMVASLAILGDIVASAGRSLCDEAGEILNSHREAATAGLLPFTGSRERAQAILSALGWE